MEKLFNSDRHGMVMVLNGTTATPYETDPVNTGDIKIFKSPINGKVYFTYKGVSKPVTTDAIDPRFVKVSFTPAELQRVYTKASVVTVADDNYLINGEIYKLTMQINNFFTDARNPYPKVAACSLTCDGSESADVKKDRLFRALGKSIQRIWKREKGGYFDVYLSTSETDVDSTVGTTALTDVDGDTAKDFSARNIVDDSGSSLVKILEGNEIPAGGDIDAIAAGTLFKAIVIVEHEQPDDMFYFEQKIVDYDLSCGQVEYNSEDVAWGKVYVTGQTIPGASDVVPYGKMYNNKNTVKWLEFGFLSNKQSNNYQKQNFPVSREIRLVEPIVDADEYDAINITYEYPGNEFSSLPSFKEFHIFAPITKGQAFADQIRTIINA